MRIAGKLLYVCNGNGARDNHVALRARRGEFELGFALFAEPVFAVGIEKVILRRVAHYALTAHSYDGLHTRNLRIAIASVVEVETGIYYLVESLREVFDTLAEHCPVFRCCAVFRGVDFRTHAVHSQKFVHCISLHNKI